MTEQSEPVTETVVLDKRIIEKRAMEICQDTGEYSKFVECMLDLEIEQEGQCVNSAMGLTGKLGEVLGLMTTRANALETLGEAYFYAFALFRRLGLPENWASTAVTHMATPSEVILMSLDGLRSKDARVFHVAIATVGFSVLHKCSVLVNNVKKLVFLGREYEGELRLRTLQYGAGICTDMAMLCKANGVRLNDVLYASVVQQAMKYPERWLLYEKFNTIPVVATEEE